MNATTKMQQHALEQGSAAWLAHRANCNNASDAGAMLGCSPYTTRSQLLHRAHTGITPDVDSGTQSRYDDGHRTEALLRPLAQDIIGEELYPIVGTREWPGITRPLGASYDGLTIARDAGFECKRLNDELRKALPHDSVEENQQQNLPKYHHAQVEQQFMVCPALERVLFGAGEFDRDGNPVDVRWVWCVPNAALRAEIAAGWAQFEQDLEDYVPPVAVPLVVAAPVQALPAVSVQVSGSIAITDNFKAFETAVRDFLEHRLIREPKTDQDFADLDVQIKAMKGAEAALESAEAQMLAQIQTVDAAKKTKDMLAKLVRDNRLMAEKLLASEKERRKGEIVAGGTAVLREHIAALNERIGKPYMPAVAADFAGAIKGLKSLASMEDKVATELARAKISANEVADRIDLNLRHLRDHAGDFKHLFPDTAAIVLKAPDDLQALVSARIAEHRAAEERRLEAERERIRAEEAAKLQREHDAAARAARAEQERQAATERAATAAPAPAPAPMQANVVPLARPTAAPSATPTLRLGVINQRIAPLSVDAAGLEALGFPPAATEKSAKLFHEADFPRMVDAMVASLRAAQQQQQQAA